jgi:hypothetical protein
MEETMAIPKDAPPSLRGPAVGDIVLFCLDDNPLELRPLLITRVSEPDLVSGTIFFHDEEDRHLRWVHAHAKLTPAREQPTCWVPQALRGEGVGNWRFK